MFIEWMNCNVSNQEARELTYVKFPTKFIWNKDNRSWIRHKTNTGAIGRIHRVAPASGDLFFLRILLNKVKGPTSYQDIRAVNGQVFNSYRDACYDLGLLDDDKEYIEAIQEAFFGEGGTQIEIELLKDLTLQEIDKLLQCNSSSLRNFITKLTSKQKEAYYQIIKAVDHGKGAVFFLYGYDGTGKTFLSKTLSAAFRSKGEIVLNVASSGIAALLLSGGRMIHSRFHIPLHPTDESFCTISPSSNLGELIRRTKLLIWDEAPMVNKMCVEALDRSMSDICRQSNPDSMDTLFGGKTLVFCGDFRQILHVIQKVKREDIVDASLNSSYLWDYATVLKLIVNMRVIRLCGIETDADTRSFAQLILDISNSDVGESEDGVFDIEIPQDLLITDADDPSGSIISTIYPDNLLNLGNPEYYQQRAILAQTHEVVNIINDRMMTRLEGEEMSYLSSDSICASQRDADFNNELYTTDFINSIEVGGLPKHNLRLKIGVPVMLLRNIDQAGGLCNCTRLQIVHFGEKNRQRKNFNPVKRGKDYSFITYVCRTDGQDNTF
ncbi:ATP-dependent DNA helicase PIF1-like [Rutidosis leptorrhynchoides]|uniref:ATP-dependent DNA helicase PIF1-like n=1 Tax=Rutidosis leptorrhynchoides TaxID=125765 RepID=UPI003A98D218